MALSPSDQARLTTLQGALDALISGSRVAKITVNGKTTEYAKGDVAELKSQIQILQAAALSPTGRTRGAIGFRG
jgi:hypothetical protein